MTQCRVGQAGNGEASVVMVGAVSACPWLGKRGMVVRGQRKVSVVKGLTAGEEISVAATGGGREGAGGQGLLPDMVLEVAAEVAC